MSATPESFRKSILAHARLVASAEAQLRYEADVPIADVPSELICGYTDDLYFPTSEVLREAFSESEQKSLAEFYGRLCVAADAFGRARVTGVRDILKLPDWRATMAFAEQLVADLETRKR